MSKRETPPRGPRAVGPDERQVFRLNISPAERKADDAKRIAQNAEKTRVRAETQKREREKTERQECRRALERSTELGTLIEAWRKMQETGDAAGLPRTTLRRIDMHVALSDPTVLDHVRRANSDARNLLDTLDRETPGSVREPDFQRLLPEGETGFDALREFGVKKGDAVVEQGANNRTEREHRAIRLSVEIALQTTNISDFLYVLDSHIRDRELTHKLTQLEIARLNDQLHRLLRSRDWPHPTQEMAQSFTAWEDIFRDATHGRYTYILERAQFQKDPTTTAEKPRRTPSFWENVVNAPSDIGKMIFDENGARTGNKNKNDAPRAPLRSARGFLAARAHENSKPFCTRGTSRRP